MTKSILDRRIGLADLVDAASFHEVCRSFTDLYKVGIKVFDADGRRLVDIKVGSGELCGYLFSVPEGRALCTETVTHIKQHPLPLVPAPDGIRVRDCFSGCRYLMVPILNEGDLLGRVVFGPFLPAEQEGLGRELLALGRVFDLERTRELAAGIRRAPDATLRKVLEHFTRILEVLLFSAYRSRLTTQLHIESVTESYRELQEKSRALKDSFERLKEMDQLKSNFLATVSHELRTPLTSVIGYSEMLLAGLAGDLSAEQREYLSTILEKGESLLNLITSLLDLSRIEARGVRIHPERTDLRRVVSSGVSTVAPSAQRKDLEIVSEVADHLPDVMADGNKIRQCVVNLLVNAVKFTPPGGCIKVRVGLAEQPPPGSGPFGRASHFEISVSDNGIGIPESEQQKIFDSFYQVDGSSTREYGGAGLGLAIVRSYTEAHGGTVRLQSSPGAGSTFTLCFPLEPAPAAQFTPSPTLPPREPPREKRATG